MAVLLLLFGLLLLLTGVAPVPVAAFVLLLVFHGHWWGWYCCFIVRLPPCVCGAILVLMEVVARSWLRPTVVSPKFTIVLVASCAAKLSWRGPNLI